MQKKNAKIKALVYLVFEQKTFFSHSRRKFLYYNSFCRLVGVHLTDRETKGKILISHCMDVSRAYDICAAAV